MTSRMSSWFKSPSSSGVVRPSHIPHCPTHHSASATYSGMPPKRRSFPVLQTSSPIPNPLVDVPFELVPHSDGASPEILSQDHGERLVEADWTLASNSSINFEEANRGRDISPVHSPSPDPRLASPPPHPKRIAPRAPPRAQSPCHHGGRSPPCRATSSHSFSPSLGNEILVHHLVEKPRHEAMRLVREFITALWQELHG